MTATQTPGEGTVSAIESADNRMYTNRGLVAGSVTLAVALAANSLLGPLFADAITYPFSETMVNQTVGLEAVTLAVVVPWVLLAAVLVSRGHRAGPFLAAPPAAYAAYMFVQYVIGPTYLTYHPVVAFHLGIFVLAGVVLALAWREMRSTTLPERSVRRDRRAAVGLLAMSAFVLVRYVESFVGMATGTDLSAEFAADPAMFWTIVFLDLGIVVPVSIGVSVGLLGGATWARQAVYAVAGWYVLVPISVAAMGTVMLLNGDPNAAVQQVVVLSLGAVLFTAFAGWVFRPLFGDTAESAQAA